MDNELHWFVGCVKSCQERRVADILHALGVEHYLAIKKEIHRWSDRRKVIDKMVIPRIIFIYCDEKTRVDLLKRIPGLYCFMSGPEKGKVATVPQKQMDDFRMMVEGSTRAIGLDSSPISPGDMVKVITGPLAGRECEVVELATGRYFIVRIPMLGAARMAVAGDTIEKLG